MTGNLRCAHSDTALRSLTAEARMLREQLGDTTVHVLGREEVVEETGSEDFLGGLLVEDAGLIHTLNYVLGLAAGLARRGARIYEESPVTSMKTEGQKVILETPQGAVEADRVLLATNGYSDLSAGTAALRRSVIPFRSAMVATAPLTADRRARLLRHGRSCSETRRMMRWFRPYEDRLIFGGRGAFGRSDSDRAFAALERAMRQIFPALRDTPVTHRWSGLVAMTTSAVPQVGRLDERVSFALGYNGAGIAMASLMGGYAADVSLGETPDLALMGPGKLQNVPLYPLREPAVRLVAGWYQFLDAIGR
ncbi:FAD dependent oxidoreductase [Lutibaculum baratangense AMV1]|uniref:FAD dependent oxidoreductase n=1 Tax=Lutibaculum baratangense AMV1 TaxID=631454 RepID=V4RHX9_9HYPH|nr:FAD dependent oxidoreductase [Lutibaculum baratangense AMV1]